MKLTAKEIRDKSPAWVRFITTTDRNILAHKVTASKPKPVTIPFKFK